VRLVLRVQPGAKRSGLLGRLPGGEWKVAVAARPVDGRANDAVVELMSDLLGVPRRQVTLARGASSRGKVIEVEGLAQAEAEARLEAVLQRKTRKDEGDARGE
jgi:uncharacterized protein YggU (UPF0235/DUF167 family)